METPKRPEGYSPFHINLREDYDGFGRHLFFAQEEMLRQEKVRGYFGRVLVMTKTNICSTSFFLSKAWQQNS